MAITPTFDPEELLAPFEGDAPCGTDPRSDMSPTSRFLRMKDARALARRKERAIDVDPDAPSPLEDWGEMADVGLEILSQEGKDLEVAAWMIEGLLRVDGLAGLYTGLKVAEGLVNNYWDEIYPLPDEDGNEPRLSPFIGLNGASGDGTLIQPLRKLGLTRSDPPMSLWQYEQAMEIEQISDPTKKEARLVAGGTTLETFTAAVQATPGSHFSALVADLAEVTAAVNALSDAFVARVGHDAPPAGAIRAALTAIDEAVRLFAADKLAQASMAAESASYAVEAGDGDAAAEDGAPAAGGGGAVPSSRPASREQALQQILQIAAFFRQTEPHSPISYTLEEVVRRGRMPLTQLLDELVVDAEARRYFYIASGLRPPEVPSE